MGDEHDQLPIVSVCVVADKNKCPPGFTPILKTYDEATDADLWKDGFGFGIFNRVVRYVAISRNVTDACSLELVTDVAIISDKEAVPSNFVCIDYTADTKERALKKRYLCVRLSPRNDTLDAVSDILILSKSKKPPKGYTIAGDVDGMIICYKVSTIPESYGRLKHSQSSDINNANKSNVPLYPEINNPNYAYRHSTTAQTNQIKGIDGVPFQLNPIYSKSLLQKKGSDFPEVPEINPAETYNYNFSLERSVIT
ncbi:multivesicular body subunit 12 domain-containing protein [Ditylenchus destructor]|uniref:Multivesicular body subunit 12 domain-containing protein n=1 Tax=Ditylenchus destructor TaxID=166010 RepID=A0AAD4R1M1_9BILA|nr:multivesicular body subunit 12 domain-containing protein [Ditylenchus destructor]